MRRILLRKVFQNSFCGIFDGFIVEHLLGRVDESDLKMTLLARLENRFIQAIGLAHTTTNGIAAVGTLEKLLRRREEYLGLQFVGTLGVSHIAQWVDKATASLREETTDCPKRVQFLRFRQAIVHIAIAVATTSSSDPSWQGGSAVCGGTPPSARRLHRLHQPHPCPCVHPGCRDRQPSRATVPQE